MTSFTKLPNRLRRTAFLTAYRQPPSARGQQNRTLPGVDPEERRIRRAAWMKNQDCRQCERPWQGQLGVVAAVLALVLMLGTAMTTSTSALERAAAAHEEAPAPVVQTDGAPTPEHPTV